MILFQVLIVILLIGLTTAAVLGKISGFMADPTSSQSFGGAPAAPWSADEIAHLHFDQALRGYRMDQVDAVIDAMTVRVHDLESEVGSQRAQCAQPAPPVVESESHDVGGEPQE